MSSIFEIKEHIISASHIREYPRATTNRQDDVLLLHVKQYTPKSNPAPQNGDISIIGAHANGFPKELYEPLWEEFYYQTKKQGFRIRDIWIADAAWQGQSGVLNADRIGNDPSWLDHSRDMLHLINHFRVPLPLVGVGHSMGANTLTNLALFHPRLFSSLVFIEPTISRFGTIPGWPRGGPATMSMYRRDVWPSRDAAATEFKKSAFYRSWDPRVLDLWVKYGLRDIQKDMPEVTLTTSKYQEVVTYLRPSWQAFDSQGTTLLRRDLVPDLDVGLPAGELIWPFYRPETQNTVDRLPNLRPSVLYIFCTKSDYSPLKLRKEKLDLTGTGLGGSGGVKAGRVHQILNEKKSHLLPMEDPRFCAEAAARWIMKDLERWRGDEEQYQVWTQKPPQEKISFDKDFMHHMGGSNTQRKSKARL